MTDVKKMVCNCHGMVCHDSTAHMFLVHFTPKVGGKGVTALLTRECMIRRRSAGLTVLKEVIA